MSTSETQAARGGLNVLLPTDGSGCSERAARFVVRLAEAAPGLRVHLLNVQPTGDDWMTRRMLKTDELAALESEWSESALGPVRTLLQDAGLACEGHALQGEVAETISRYAEKLGCDLIVMGSHGRTGLAGLVMGSIATQVLHLSRVPVTFVK